VPEATLKALWQHEIRWMRTIRTTAPVALAASTLQYPLFWTMLAVLFSGAAPWSLALFGLGWAVRLVSVMGMNAALRRKLGRRAPAASPLLLPVRDLLSVIEIGASYWVEDVVWRGHRLGAYGIAARPLATRVGGAGG
jgi:ceramide glucosyltransferase